MAITTRDKRASSIAVGGVPLYPLPDVGAEDQGDRQQTAFTYRGVLAGDVQLPTAINPDLTTAWSIAMRSVPDGPGGMNERMLAYLRTTYGSQAELNVLLTQQWFPAIRG